MMHWCVFLRKLIGRSKSCVEGSDDKETGVGHVLLVCYFLKYPWIIGGCPWVEAHYHQFAQKTY